MTTGFRYPKVEGAVADAPLCRVMTTDACRISLRPTGSRADTQTTVAVSTVNESITHGWLPMVTSAKSDRWRPRLAPRIVTRVPPCRAPVSGTTSVMVGCGHCARSSATQVAEHELCNEQ